VGEAPINVQCVPKLSCHFIRLKRESRHLRIAPRPDVPTHASAHTAGDERAELAIASAVGRDDDRSAR